MSGTSQNRRKQHEEEIEKTYLATQERIRSRLDEFRRTGEKGSEHEIFAELIFCLLTPQSKAQSCWTALTNLRSKRLLFEGNVPRIARELNIVRFKNKKAAYIVQARERFCTRSTAAIRSTIRKLGDPTAARRWLVTNVKGLGYKEASHFLRNIGLGGNLAILDRHILKNLKLCGVIDTIPNNISARRYEAIEKRMQKFARRLSIPLSHLDFVLWYKETGEIFK